MIEAPGGMRGSRARWVFAAVVVALAAILAAVLLPDHNVATKGGPIPSESFPAVTPPVDEGPPKMPEPVAGSLAQNVVITERRFGPDAQLFHERGKGIVMFVENRNYRAVHIDVEGIVYDGRTVVARVPATYAMDARQALLIPLEVDANLRSTTFEAKVLRVRAG